MPTMFQKLPRSLLETTKNHWLFEHVATAIREQVEGKSYDVNLGRLAAAPAPVRTVYWLWRFQCEAGISGMDVFVLDWLGIYSPQVHRALKDIRAAELVRLFEAAISLACSGPAEFNLLPDQSWFRQFPVTTEFPELDLINRPAFPLLDALSDVVADYIRLNERDLFQISE